MKQAKKEQHKAVRSDAMATIDRVFDDWVGALPRRRPHLFGPEWSDGLIHVDEFRDNGSLVVRAEIPGIDPDKDVDLSLCDGMLRIVAHHREEKDIEERGYVRHELRRGSFVRQIPVPHGVTEADISAKCKDGILEVRVPTPLEEPATKIPIEKG